MSHSWPEANLTLCSHEHQGVSQHLSGDGTHTTQPLGMLAAHLTWHASANRVSAEATWDCAASSAATSCSCLS